MNLVKLGGSVLTDKSAYRTLRDDVLARLARELATAPEPVVLVHGAGSFGHVVAREHALAAGRAGTREQDAAAARVHADVRDLHRRVLGALADADVPAVGVSPFDVATLRDGALAHFDAAPIARALERGLAPVTFGDLVCDASRGWGILSGDVILEALARELKPSRAIAVTDVTGIFDKPPREPGARLVADVTAADAARLAGGESRGPDVTGGMTGKIARLAAVAHAGTPVLVVDGLAPGRLKDALAGRKVEGTRIRPGG